MNKWLKYEVLKKCGLLSSEELEKNIRRYAIKDRFDLLEDIKLRLKLNLQQNRFTIIKFVEIGVTYGLKNYKVVSHADIKGLKDLLLDEVSMMEYSEVWWCESSSDFGYLSYAGRFSYNLEYLKRENSFGKLEIVIGKSPRVLSLGDPEIYKEMTWPEFINGNCNSFYSDGKEENKVLYNKVLQDFSENIINYKMGLTMLWKAFIDIGLSTVSLEFKRSDLRLEIIDFDTEADSYVIEYFGFHNIL